MMKPHCFSASAYGSLMLMGEHSVLHGGKAVVSATKHGLTASVSSREDNLIAIHSALGHYRTHVDDVSQNTTFRFVLSSIRHCIKTLKITQGFDIHYQSTIPTTIGLGSSAASVVATVRALYQLNGQSIDNHSLWKECKAIIIEVQGRGSGADLCASIYGEVCLFNTQDGFLSHLNTDFVCHFYWQLHYCGYKETTDKVLLKTHKLEQQHPLKTKAIYQQMATITEQFIAAIEQEKITALAEAMNAYQQQMIALQVSDNTLNGMIKELRQHPAILGAKISGSGLGDCVLSVSSSELPSTLLSQYPRYPCLFF